MTRIEELEQKIDMIKIDIGNLGLELSDCQKALAELKESKKENGGKWKPKLGEYYWYRDSWGDFKTCEFTNKENLQWRYNNVPMFPNVEKCKKYWHFMDTVKEKSYSFSKEEWEDSTVKKYYIEYTYSLKNFDVMIAYNCRDFDNIYFKTAKDAKHIIDNFKEELMTYWL